MPKPNTTGRLLSYFKPHKRRLALAILLMGAQALIPGTLVLLIEQVLDQALIAKDGQALAWLPLALVGLYAFGGVLTVARGMLTRSIAWEVITTLRAELFWHLLHLDARWHQKHPTGATLARLTGDVTTIQYGVSGIVTAIQQPLTLVVLLAAAAWMNTTLTLVSIVVLPLVAWPIIHFGRKLRESSRDSLDNMAALTATAAESLEGMAVVSTCGGEKDRSRRFDAINQTQHRLQMEAFLARLLPGPVVELIAAVGVGLVLWVGGQQVFTGEIQAGELIAFMVALGLLNTPLKGISKINNLLQQASAGADNVFAILDTAPAIPDLGTQPAPTQPSTLRFEGVCFDYGENPVLKRIDFEVQAGNVVAIVGSSGAGKSTIAKLISRLIDPVSGSITLNDIHLQNYDLASLRGSLAVVSQEAFLFDESIGTNIGFGTNASHKAIQDAAKTANAHGFIMALKDGYDTQIDAMGMALSGGERQRICIARALLRNAPILILDEATSALDTHSEALVQQALERLMKDRTVIAIAHRLSTIRHADRILVLEDGRIVEQGTHTDLVTAAGPYAKLIGEGHSPSPNQRPCEPSTH
jgi:subfamily B ATP-binding cassette protein MsbA